MESLPDGTNYSSFSLTSKGVIEVQKLLNNNQWKTVLGIVTRVKKQLGNIPLERLLDQVHDEYPDYRKEY
jgi:hypothetical protein